MQQTVTAGKHVQPDPKATAIENLEKIEVSFKNKDSAEVATEVQERLVKMLQDLGFSEAKSRGSVSTQAVTIPGSRGQAQESGVEFRFAIPGISGTTFNGVLSEGGSVSLSGLPNNVKMLTIDYGSPTYKVNRRAELEPLGRNLDICVIDPANDEKVVLTQLCNTVRGKSIVDGASSAEAAVVFRPDQKALTGAEAVEEMDKLAGKYPALREPLEKMGMPIKAEAISTDDSKSQKNDLNTLVLPKVKYDKDQNQVIAEGPVILEYSGRGQAYIEKSQKGNHKIISIEGDTPTLLWKSNSVDPQTGVEATIPVLETAQLSVQDLEKLGGFDGKVDTFVAIDGNEVLNIDHHSGTCKLDCTGKNNKVSVLMSPLGQGQFLIDDTSALSSFNIRIAGKDYEVKLNGHESAGIKIQVDLDGKPKIEIGSYPEELR